MIKIPTIVMVLPHKIKLTSPRSCCEVVSDTVDKRIARTEAIAMLAKRIFRIFLFRASSGSEVGTSRIWLI